MKAPRTITARNLLLDLFRTSPSNDWPVKKLIEVANLFNINANAIRVNLTRLLSTGLIETNNRGFYRLNWKYDPVRDWIDEWVKGEERVIEWDGRWLCLHPTQMLKKKEWEQLDKASNKLGFRSVEQRMWVRPNNLKLSVKKINELIETLSDLEDFIFTISEVIYFRDTKISVDNLWDVPSLELSYRTCIQKLKSSKQSLANGDEATALRDSFILGGEAIHLLTLDPLLPDEMIDQKLRNEVNDAAHEYIGHFNALWRKTFGPDTMETLPKYI